MAKEACIYSQYCRILVWYEQNIQNLKLLIPEETKSWAPWVQACPPSRRPSAGGPWSWSTGWRHRRRWASAAGWTGSRAWWSRWRGGKCRRSRWTAARSGCSSSWCCMPVGWRPGWRPPRTWRRRRRAAAAAQGSTKVSRLAGPMQWYTNSKGCSEHLKTSELVTIFFRLRRTCDHIRPTI